MADNFSKAMKVVSTLALGNLAGVCAFKLISIVPSLEEQENIAVTSKVMGAILKRSTILPISSILGSSANLALYFKDYGTPNEDKFYLCTGLLMLTMAPYTITCVAPINANFTKEGETFEGDDGKWKGLFSDWKKWHIPRVAWTATLFAVYVYKHV